MSKLAEFLTERKLVARPRKGRATPINNSGLSLLKARLLGFVEKEKSAEFFAVGSEVHKRVLEPKRRIKRFEKAVELKIVGMVDALKKNAFLMSLLAGAVIEKKLTGEVMGVLMYGTLDINRAHDLDLIGDIKTTSAKTRAECVKSCIKYGYFRQAIVYMTLAKASNFVFVFVTKSVPHRVFLIDVSKYPKEMEAAREELRFLLYFWKTYGMPNPKATIRRAA